MKLRASLICYVLIICMLMNGMFAAAAGVNIQTDINYNSNLQTGSINSQSFPDIEGHWCREYIEKFLKRKWVVGYDDGLFHPDRFVTRAEFTAMVVNIFKKDNNIGDCSFTDVKKDDWFYSAVSYAANEGLIRGYEDNTFKPMDNMTRQDAAVLVAKLFDVNFFEEAPDYRFEDEDTFPEYSYKSIKNLASHEIIKGYPDGTFKPYRLITRAEAVRMLDVVLKYIEVPEETMPAAPPETPRPTATYTPKPTLTSKPSKNTGTGGGTVKEPEPEVTKDPVPTEEPIPTVVPIPTELPVIYRTYTSTEDFNEGQLNNLTTRIKDQLVLEDRKIDQNTGSIQKRYGEKKDSLYIEVTQRVSKSMLMPSSDTVEINVDLKGIGDPLVIERDPIDLVIAIDDSGSMEWGNTDNVAESPNRLDYAKEASKGVIDLMQSFDRAAVVEFAGSAWVQQELTNDKEVLKQSIDNTPVSPWDGTAIGIALSKSIEIIEKQSDAGRQKVILLLSDGADNRWTYSQIIQLAEEAKVKGIKIYCVGLGSGADQDLLKEISNITQAGYSFSPTMEELEEMMFEAGKEIFDVAGKNLVFETSIEDYAIVSEISPEPSKVIDNGDGSKRYQWNYDSLVIGAERNLTISLGFNELPDVSKLLLMKDAKLSYQNKENELIEVYIDDVLLPVSRYSDEGSWIVVYDSEHSGTKWGSIYWNAKVYNDGSIEVKVSSSEDGKTYSKPVNVSNYSSFDVPDGRYVKLEVELKRSSDGYSPELFDITIAEKDYKLPEYENAAPIIEEILPVSGVIGKPIWLISKVSDDCITCGKISFSWKVISGNADKANITDADSFMAKAVFSEPGEYSIEFKTDDGGEVSKSIVKVVVVGTTEPTLTPEPTPMPTPTPTIEPTPTPTPTIEPTPTPTPTIEPTPTPTPTIEPTPTPTPTIEPAPTPTPTIEPTPTPTPTIEPAPTPTPTIEPTPTPTPTIEPTPTPTPTIEPTPTPTPTIEPTPTPTPTIEPTPTPTPTIEPTPTPTPTPTPEPTTIIVDDYEKPVVKLEMSSTVVSQNSEVTIRVTATDNVKVESIYALYDGEPVELDERGIGTIQADKVGLFEVRAIAVDKQGNEGYAKKELFVKGTADNIPPEVLIESPVENSKITTLVDIIGTVYDENLVKYVLEYSEKDKGQYIKFAEGNTSVRNGVLGKLDATIMRNGQYDIKLSAYDSGGYVSSYTVSYIIEGEQKVGNFSMSFEDLTIPVSGLPITIVRTYDSRNKEKGDFGIGWTMALRDIKIDENYVPGEHWKLQSSGGTLSRRYDLYETKEHIISVTYPDGRVDKFGIKVTPSTQQFFPIQYTTVNFVAKAGTNSKLEALDVSSECLVINNTDGYGLYTFDAEYYNPDRYKLTTQDGTVYIISQKSGVESITDANGNTITFGRNGITHSAGKSIIFKRDEQGRITEIIDPMGNSIKYEYDYYGDLVKVTDPEYNSTRFIYNSSHGLIDIIDPRGVKVARNEYDDNGRIIAHIDAEGNRIEYSHDLDAKQEIIKDRLGNITVISYDDNGNVISKTDAMGNTTTYTYDENGNMLTETDALGNTTTYTYDSNNNMLSSTDSMGNKTEYTYNSKGQLLTKTDPLGNTITNTYDEKGNLISITDPDGNILSFTYDSKGNMKTMTDPKGNVTSFTYDSDGNILSKTDSKGNTTTYTYDVMGNLLTETIKNGDKIITTSYEYDSMGRLVKTTDAYGYSTIVEYNSIGKKSTIIDKLGRRTEYIYDAFGNLEQIIYPDGTTEKYTYDKEGRKVTSTDREGNTTHYLYDKLGRLIKITYPDGTYKETEYDANGQLIREIDERGNVTKYTYDKLGRNTSVTDTLGNTTFYEYDANGNLTKVIDANGNTVCYEYDSRGNCIKTSFEDGSFILTKYNENGMKVSETDRAGNTTKFEYDSLGRLIRVIDAEGNITSYEYDSIGKMISQTDSNGNTTTFEYDMLGRRIKRTLPMGMVETYIYDAVGNITSITDFNGNTITFEYDINDRIITKRFPDGTKEVFTYTPLGQRKTVTDSRGTTYFEYDVRGRLIKETNPYGISIKYTYDEVGNRTSVTVPSGTTIYTYDALNRLSTVTDPDGGVTIYEYDSVGNRKRLTYPNGIKTEYEYDKLNQLTKLVNLKADGEIMSCYEFTLGPAGNRIKIKENTGRIVDYEYDKTYKLLKETTTYQGQIVEEISYTYDKVGNRLSMTSNGTTIQYTYDKNNRLLSEDNITYTYDNNGNILLKEGKGETVSYSYDYDNRLKKVVTTNEAGTQTVEYIYDVDGIRVEKIVDGMYVSRYTVDKNRIYCQVLEERDLDNKLVVSYIYGDDLISQKRGEKIRYYHYDGLGSTRALTDAEGKVTDTYTYGAFGTLIDITGNTINEYLFTGQQYDSNVGFYYLRARYMNPSIGRFHTMDPYEGKVFDPSSLHKYIYCNNNPVNFVDYLGLYTDAVIGTFIHNHIRDTLYPGENILRGMIPGWTQRLFPDIADLGTKEVYEIKPLSPYGVATGPLQLAVYIDALNKIGGMISYIGTGWKAGTWIPPYGPHIEPISGRKYIVIGNLEGVIFYWFPKREMRERSWEKVKQVVFSVARESEDIINAYVLNLQLTVIELQDTTETLIKVAIGATIAYVTYDIAYTIWRLSLASLSPVFCFI